MMDAAFLIQRGDGLGSRLLAPACMHNLHRDVSVHGLQCLADHLAALVAFRHDAVGPEFAVQVHGFLRPCVRTVAARQVTQHEAMRTLAHALNGGGDDAGFIAFRVGADRRIDGHHDAGRIARIEQRAAALGDHVRRPQRAGHVSEILALEEAFALAGREAFQLLDVRGRQIRVVQRVHDEVAEIFGLRHALARWLHALVEFLVGPVRTPARVQVIERPQRERRARDGGH